MVESPDFAVDSFRKLLLIYLYFTGIHCLCTLLNQMYIYGLCMTLQ